MTNKGKEFEVKLSFKDTLYSFYCLACVSLGIIASVLYTVFIFCLLTLPIIFPIGIIFWLIDYFFLK